MTTGPAGMRDSVTILPMLAMFFGGCPGTIMIRNGLYSLTDVGIDGVDVEVGGVLILRDGQIHGGDSFVFYTGTYDSSDGKWKGEIISQEHTPTTRPVAERVQHFGFSGIYNDAGVEADATALVGKQRIRYDATLRLLAAI
jgi:T3SS negative regulator,GrlR